MTAKISCLIFFLTATLIILVSNSFAIDINRVPPFVTDPNAPQPTQKPPANPPWDWAGNKEPISVPPGGHIWIGCYNTYDPNRTKEVSFRMKASWEDELEIESAAGYTPTGSTVTGSTDDPNGRTDIIGPEGILWFGRVNFKCQPEWEAIKIRNKSSNVNLLSQIKMTYWCWNYSSVGNMCDLYEATIGHPENSRVITQLLMTHTQATVDLGVLPGLTDSNPANIWSVAPATTDPITGLTLPQGGWRWTCTSGPGIASGEPFSMTMKVNECMPEGKFALYVYDESEYAETDWEIYYAYDEDPEPMTGDISQPSDCIVNLEDFAVVADNWLAGVY